MMDHNADIEKNIHEMKNFFNKLDSIIDSLPYAVSEPVKKLIREKILGDKPLKEFMEDMEDHRPPRFLLVGRTGAGKSSLINALCGSYTAKVSNVKSCTSTTVSYKCCDNGRELMEILDTRGIAESEQLNNNITAEEELTEAVKSFSPDAAVLVLNCTHRDDVDKDVRFMKMLAEEFRSLSGTELPVIAVLNKCDETAPSYQKIPSQYSQTKKDNISEQQNNFKKIIDDNGLKICGMTAVSSLMSWQTPDGTEIDEKEINKLTPVEIGELEICFDGRYNIDKLYEILLEVIQDRRARAGMIMAARLETVMSRIADRLTKIFAGISSIVAATPIPISDMYVLFTLQCFLVSLIAKLSGREMSPKTAVEFILSLCGTAGVGLTCRVIAQQLSKFLNIGFGAGSVISSTIAASGTMTIGKAAAAYYIERKPIEKIMPKSPFGKRSA